MLWISGALVALWIALHIRNKWVLDRRTELNRIEGGVHVIREYADYDTMMLRFWVWDVNKFKTSNQ